ncbi:putative intracellular protease/amidase [Pseudodesulfovibrio profundus]|uniref:Putative intracellular protease/amidase n=2 Tax=Pseudodesulfovibrio profundus TaxID=57320 RepID=A0A2C8F9Q3_9BACT|nr:putative intracellular protease/amidase [Pseudodesulfovibrio profundus]
MNHIDFYCRLIAFIEKGAIMSRKNVLFIVTSHASLGDEKETTGLWLEELAAPYYAFIDAGCDVRIVSISGGSVPIDPKSQAERGENPESVERFLDDKNAMAAIQHTPSVAEVDTFGFDALFIPGGHGTMWDMPDNEHLAKLVAATYESGRIVAAVCHGPAGLVGARLSNGEPLVKDRDVSAFTDSEEEAVGLTDTVPFLLESRLTELGANVRSAPNFEPFALADGNLITGQNPPSSEKVAELVLRALKM